MHIDKVIGYIAWYQDIFDDYNVKIRRKLAFSALANVQGEIPANLDDIMAFVDCTKRTTISFL